MKLLLFAVLIVGSTYVASGQTTSGRLSKEEIAAQDAYLSAQIDTYMGRHDKAISKLLKLHQAVLTNEVIAFDLAKSYLAIEDYPNADKYASIAIRQAPENIWMQVFYAKLMVQMEKYNQAATAFSDLVALDPLDFSHIDNQAKALISAGKEKEAIQIIDRWERDFGIREELVQIKFAIFTQRNDYEKAEKELLKLITIAPENARFLNNMATFYKKNGKRELAKNYFEKVLVVDPNNAKANAGILTLVDREQRDGPYLRTLLPLIEKKDIDPDLKVVELIPYVHQLMEEYNEQLASSLLQLTESLSLIHPSHAKSMAIRADVLSLTGQNIDAIAAYKKTIGLSKTVYEVWEQLLNLLAIENKYVDLSDQSFAAMDYFPNKPLIYYYYGMAQNELDNPNEGIDYLEEGEMIAANDKVVKSKITAELGRSYLLKNQIEQAESYIIQSLELSNNQNPFAWEIKGDIASHKGESVLAQECWHKAKTLGSNRPQLLQKLNQ